MKKLLLLIFTISIIHQANAQWNGVTPIVTTSNTSAKTSPAAINDGSGNMFIAWIDARNSATSGNDIYLQKINSDGTKPWGAEKIVCDAIGSQSNVYIAADGSGGVLVIWQDPRNTAVTGDDIYAQRFNSSGSSLWTPNGVLISDAVNTQSVPLISMISATEAVAYWRDSRGTTSDPYANKILISDGSKQWTDVQLSDAAGTQTNYAILPDGSNGIFLVWEDPTGTPSLTTDRDIFGQRLNNSGVKQWSPTSTIGHPLISVVGAQQTPSICSDGAGGFVAIFADQRTGTNGGGDIYAQRFDNTGTKVWANDVRMVDAAGFQSNPSIVKSGNKFVAMWSDPRIATSNRNIYVQQLDINGALQWTPNGGVALDGLPIVTSTGHQPASSTTSGFVMTDDGLGGAYIVWDDARGTNNSIYTQKVNNDASLSFAVDGALIASSTAGNQRTPVVINHPTNGVIIGWLSSAVSTNGEIYAANLKTDGTLPVTYTSITATANSNQTINVKWNIASEVNTEKYTVERADDNGLFTKIGEVKAAKLSTYNFLDINPIKGTNYYRVTGIDFDGTLSLSPIASAKLDNLQTYQVSVYPNPVQEEINIVIPQSLQGSKTLSFKIYDVTGSLKLSKEVAITNQVNYNFSLSTLATGVYTLIVSDDLSKLNANHKIVKQ